MTGVKCFSVQVSGRNQLLSSTKIRAKTIFVCGVTTCCHDAPTWKVIASLTSLIKLVDC